MMYEEVLFKDIAVFKYGKMPDKKKLQADGYPVFSGYRYVGYYPEYNTEERTIVVVARGVGGTGDVKLTKEKCYLTNLSISAEIKDSGRVLPEYLYYYFQVNNLRYLDSGSAQSQITIADLGNVVIPLPDISIQKKIVEVLSAFDEQISLNERINDNLMAQAQTLFKKNILDLSDEHPEWQKGSLTDIAEYLNGLAMQKYRPSEKEEGIPVMKIRELRQGFCDMDSELCTPSIKKDYIIQDGDVIFSWSGSLLVDFWCGGKCGLNQHLFKVTSKKFDKWFYYLWTNYYLEKFIKIAEEKATTMGHIKREDISKSEVIIPNEEHYNQTGADIAPLYDMVINNRVESFRLASIRDALTTELIAGRTELLGM